MINTGTGVLLRNQVLQNIALEPKVKVLAEFNNNRFANPQVKLNSTIFDESMDKDSIAGLNRPQQEIRYAIAGYAKCTSKTSQTPRYRAGGDDVRYEYLRSNVLGSANNGQFNVEVGYDSTPANVLYAKFNTHGGVVRPSSVEVSYRTGESWIVIGNFSPNSSGELTLYRQSNGTWTTSVQYDFPITNLNGVRIKVITAAATGRTELVELASKFVTDMSASLTDHQLSYSKDEPSLTQPMGVAQSGTLTLSFDDTSNQFAQTLVGQYRKYIERDAKFVLSLGYVANGQSYYIDQPPYWSDSWNYDSENGTISVSCTDRSRWLQKSTIGDVVFEDCDAKFIAQELLEMTGNSGVSFQQAAADGVELLPWVWYSDDESVWSAIDLVARAVNASFYYGASGDLVWTSKFKRTEAQTPVYKFSSEYEGSSVPNLFGFSQQFEDVYNRVKVVYEELDPNVNALGETARQSLWELTDTTLLRSADLQQEITNTTSTVVFIDPEEILTWPFEGKFQIEGEIFSYEGKYHTNGQISKTAEEAKTRGAFSGRFGNVERAIDGSTPDLHVFGNTGGKTQFKSLGTGENNTLPVTTTELKNGRFKVKQNGIRSSYGSTTSYNCYTAFTRGVNIDAYEVYGTEIIFPSSGKNRKEGIAGMMLHRQSGTGSAAYYFELATNDYVFTKRNGSIGNLRVYRNNGSVNIGKPALSEDPTGAGLRGYDFSVEYDTPYKLEIRIGDNLDGVQTFYVYINGVFIMKFSEEIFTSGLWGVYVRGDTEAEFEYYYAYENDADRRFSSPEQELSTYVAQQRLFDRISGDYTYMGPELAQAGRVGKFRWFFEEFQPVVHERREFEVEYSVAPAFNYVFFNSNPTGTMVSGTLHSPFSTKFTIDNASRKNEYIAGQDPDDNNYFMQLLGQPMARVEAKEVLVKDAPSIREHGVNEIELSNPWIQTEEDAKEQAKYIRQMWAQPLDAATAEVQYDPTIELGDLVEVHHPQRSIFNRKYFVTGINVSYDNGFSCSLTLRRVRV